MANIVSVAVEEYGKGVDAQGRLISADEYQEAVDFLKDARAPPRGCRATSALPARDARLDHRRRQREEAARGARRA